MITWNNLDTLTSYQELEKTARVNLAEVMTGEKGAERVKKYSVPMAEGLVYHYAAKQVDDTVLDALKKLADEAQLAEKFKALYNGEVINTGEKRLVLHHMTRGPAGRCSHRGWRGQACFLQAAAGTHCRIRKQGSQWGNHECCGRKVYHGCSDRYRRQ